MPQDIRLKDSDSVVYSSRTGLPFKWLPLEFFKDNDYGFEGDVWEYGCFLIEILTLGEDPSIMVQKNNCTSRRDDFDEYVNQLSTGIDKIDSLFGTKLRTIVEKALNVEKHSRINFDAI